MKVSEFIGIDEAGRPVSYYPSISRIFGIKETIFICQFIYWSDKSTEEQGWVYKTTEELESETGLSYEEQWRVRTHLRSIGALKEKHNRAEHLIYFKIDKAKILSLFRSKLPVEYAPNSRRKKGGQLVKAQLPKEGGAVGQSTTGQLVKAQLAVGQSTTTHESDHNSRARASEITSEITEAEITSPIPPKGVKEWAEEIYEAYPKKVGKPAALRAIEAQIGKSPKHCEISPFEILERTKALAALWEGVLDKQYCPHPATWFNQRRFTDDPSTWGPKRSKPQNISNHREVRAANECPENLKFKVV